MDIPKHEIEIVSLLKKGDQSGIPLLYKHYSGAVYGIVKRIIDRDEVAQEVLQDVFVKVWQNAEKYNPSKGRLFTWMAQIARNTSLSAVRSGNFQRDMKTDSIQPGVYDNERLSEEMNIKDSGLANVLENMDEKYRLLIDYIYFRGYSQREAAEALSLPVGTVKTRIRSAILDLRTTLGKEFITLLIAVYLLISYLSI